MPETKGRLWLHNLKIRWMIFDSLRLLAISLAVSILILAIVGLFLPSSFFLAVVLFAIVFGFSLLIKPVWKLTDANVARWINHRYPEVEESADLVLIEQTQLSALQILQKKRVENRLLSLPKPAAPLKQLRAAFVILLFALGISYAITRIAKSENVKRNPLPITESTSAISENIPSTIKDYSTTIIPPLYTRNPSRKLKQFAVRAEVGAKVVWSMETNLIPRQFSILFNDKENIPLKPNSGGKKFGYERIIDKPGFYQFEIDGKKSDLYQIEVIHDLPVAIKITSPKPQTTIDIGEPQKISLNATLTDDYGITQVFISATMASGKGEGVSFTAKKLSFDTKFNNQKTLNLTKQISLKDLGMKPGDELYFYVGAIDNHGQSSRSPIYLVSIVDTTELMSMAGMTNGVSLVPEYFRSQRQIIIDTEKLLKDQTSLSSGDFKQRSNALGIDQKLLRLRYGKFLGEEDETEIGGDHGEDDHQAHTEEPKFGDVSAIAEKYAHKHDNAEDATFFEPELKSQLKAVLTEMWKSELQLRTYKPSSALPFEYKALRLLKDLQQKSRVYVAKTTIKKTALKPEKRLSGELDKITQPYTSMSLQQKENRTVNLKAALALLEDRKTGKKFNGSDKMILNETEKYLLSAAADHPQEYLKALTSLRRVVSGNLPAIKDLETAQRAIQFLVAREQPKPYSAEGKGASSLYQNYFNNLKKMDR